MTTFILTPVGKWMWSICVSSGVLRRAMVPSASNWWSKYSYKQRLQNSWDSTLCYQAGVNLRHSYWKWKQNEIVNTWLRLKISSIIASNGKIHSGWKSQKKMSIEFWLYQMWYFRIEYLKKKIEKKFVFWENVNETFWAIFKHYFHFFFLTLIYCSSKVTLGFLVVMKQITNQSNEMKAGMNK